MADTVPVCDVLSEAMEYLSKLGSNLRVRSENLKQKKFKKHQLRNSHAVQKAASKVLLICELSKKSIENVETGIKKVLKQIVASQSSVSDGGKITSHKSSSIDDDIKYEYFNYQSRKLKIREKINVQHYTSVKVVAQVMPIAMQDKYPVYHDCKLYRLRKNQSTSNYNISTEIIDSDNNVDEEQNIKDKHSDSELSTQGEEKKLSNKGSEISKMKIKKDKKGDVSIAKEKQNKSIKTKKFKHIKVFNDSSDDENENLNDPEKENVASPNSTECDAPHKDISETCTRGENIPLSASPKRDGREDNIEKVDIISNNDIEKKLATILGENSNSNEDSNVTLNENKDTPTESDIEEMQIANSKCQKEDITDKCKSDIDSAIISKENHNKVSNATLNENKVSESDNEEMVPIISKTFTESLKTGDENIENFSKSVTHAEDSNSDDDFLDKLSTDKPSLDKNDDSQSSSNNKPFIKCVNINKLLKEDKKPFEIIDKDKEEKLTRKNKQKENVSVKEKRHKKAHDKNKQKPLKEGKKFQSEKCKQKSNCDEDYWKIKQSEVTKFKAKEFHINITRFPQFTQDYLCSHNLKRIIQNGKCIFEIVKQSEKDDTEKNISKDILNVKSSLLNDSDSDEHENLKNMSEILKSGDDNNTSDQNPTLCESDQNESNTCDDSKENNVEDNGSKTPDSISSSKKNEALKSPQQDEIKSSLLNDSTDENSLNKKRIGSSNSFSPSSKRKRMMESIHAKKMLLTYSSSSDTEDEELKTTLKEIRENLLEGNSSDDEKKEDNNEKIQSESEVSSIFTNKRKRPRTTSSSSHYEKFNDKVSGSDSTSKKTFSQTEDNGDEMSSSSSKKVRRE